MRSPLTMTKQIQMTVEHLKRAGVHEVQITFTSFANLHILGGFDLKQNEAPVEAASLSDAASVSEAAGAWSKASAAFLFLVPFAPEYMQKLCAQQTSPK